MPTKKSIETEIALSKAKLNALIENRDFRLTDEKVQEQSNKIEKLLEELYALDEEAFDDR